MMHRQRPTAAQPARVEPLIDKFSPEIATLSHALRETMHALLPRGFEMVYDNYNALAIGYGPSQKVSELVFSLVLYPRWVHLYFMQGAALNNPNGFLQGSGSRGRHVRIDSVELLLDAQTRELMQQAVLRAQPGWDAAPALRSLIKSVTAPQRPRR